MSNPVPGFTVKTPYHRRGPLWRTCGKQPGVNGKKPTALHTGVDFPAPLGTTVVAARAGTTKHVVFGSAFGTRQLAVLCADGTEDFYAHMSARAPDGKVVAAGDKVGEVGNSSEFTIGFHLHFERHNVHAAHWSCDVVENPGPSLRDGPTGMAHGLRVLLSELHFGEKESSSVRRLQRALKKHRAGDDPAIHVTGNYLDETDTAVRLCQQRHGFGNDAPASSNVGPLQAAHLFGSTKLIVDDR
jgi:murein DD-endopeptidase MepM/ murein hydrolase activator NlpD